MPMSENKLLPFLVARNLVDTTLEDGCPWDFHPDDAERARVRNMRKEARREWTKQLSTDWQVYTAVAGACPSAIISKDSPPARVLGIVVDYDTEMSVETVVGILNQ